MEPIETALPPEKREEIRQRTLAMRPRWYSGWLHLASPSVVGMGTIVAAALLVQDVLGWEWAVIPATLLFLNAVEWNIHKYLLHRRSRLVPLLYDRHTPEHHMIFLTEDMPMRSTEEFFLVLIPPYGIVLAGLAVAPFTLGLWWLGQSNAAWLFMATAVGYTMVYEWTHLAYHLPEDTLLGRSKLIKRLAHHHAVHHDPRLMQQWNFNVTLPLWDWVRGTIWSGERPAD